MKSRLLGVLLGIFTFGPGFVMGSGIFGDDPAGLIAYIFGFIVVCLFSALKRTYGWAFFYAFSFGAGMLFGIGHWVSILEEGLGSGIIWAFIVFGTIGSAALGSFAVWIARQRRPSIPVEEKRERIEEETFEEQQRGRQEEERRQMPILRGIMCPYCLSRDGVGPKGDGDEEHFVCLSCSTIIPREYARNTRIPREVVSAVGFRGHGKTVYFASLFHTMDNLAHFWPGFYTFAIDEKSLDIVRQNSKLLKAGELPAATLMNFPTPTIVRFSNIPSLGDRFFLFYDTSGEAYARQSALIQHASFVRRSRAVIFILSLDDLEHEDQKMHELLSTYVQGLTELDGNTKNQHLIVVLSKGDRLKKRLEEHEYIWRYLEEGRLDKLGNEKLGNYMNGMKRISRGLRDFVRDDLGEAQFLNFAGDRFKSVEFSIISALGAEPAGNRLQVEITPKRIIDPILWVVYKSKGPFQKGYI